jgi:hypothetical protein
MAKSPAWTDSIAPICRICGGDKSVVSFGKGKVGVCNSCSKAEWNAQNPVKVRAQRLYGNAQKRAKANGWPKPDFGSEWIEEKILLGRCEATGIPFDLVERRNGIHAANPWVPSVDRIDSSKPYSKDNVQIVVYMYNVCKSEFSHMDVVKFCRMLVLEDNNAI